MNNFKVIMSFDGSNYHGFQRQENAIAVQQILEDTIEKTLGEKVVVYGCSRTDSGVHANNYCFNVKLHCKINSQGFIRALNCNLPDDIAIKSCEIVDDDFHARYDTKAKEYIYLIHNSAIKNPFLKDRAYRYWLKLDEKKLDRISKEYIGTYDYSGFCSAKSVVQKTTKTIYDFKVERDGDIVKFTVKGDGFLYNMVRIMIGTLLHISEGKIPEDTLGEIILSKDRKRAGRTVPASGLYLNNIFY